MMILLERFCMKHIKPVQKLLLSACFKSIVKDSAFREQYIHLLVESVQIISCLNKVY